MERYKDNGICDFLKETCTDQNRDSEIRFFDTDKSLLVVADKRESKPLCLIIDDRVRKGGDPSVLSEEEKRYGNECFVLAKQAGLPLFWVRYVDREILQNDDEVYLWHSGSETSEMKRAPIRTLADLLNECGIRARLERRMPQKRKNDSLSSAFHIWQRECLWVGIFTDLDLIRMREGRVVELIELKRSYVPFSEWNPYNDDINNFAILSNFCELLGGVDFHIVFNAQLAGLPQGLDEKERIYYRRIEKKDKGVYYDKIDRLKLYQVERREHVYYYPLPYPVLLGVISIKDFLNYDMYRSFLAATYRDEFLLPEEGSGWED
ncbi:MAG: hypothetical protein HFI93_05100 [Lachnospiraceae bacterium]|nr:hypothetical protein [Lachnospiraceae bacterium]